MNSIRNCIEDFTKNQKWAFQQLECWLDESKGLRTAEWLLAQAVALTVSLQAPFSDQPE